MVEWVVLEVFNKDAAGPIDPAEFKMKIAVRAEYIVGVQEIIGHSDQTFITVKWTDTQLQVFRCPVDFATAMKTVEQI